MKYAHRTSFLSGLWKGWQTWQCLVCRWFSKSRESPVKVAQFIQHLN